MRDHEAELREAGAGIAAVGLGDMRYAQAFREDSGITFPLLVDEKREAYRALDLKKASLLHLLKAKNFRARQRARAEGHHQHKLGKDPLQLGGTFVFAPGDAVWFAHVSETFGDNAPLEDVLRAVRARQPA